MAKIEVDEKVLAGMLWALSGFKFKLCQPIENLNFDGRIKVWKYEQTRRLRQFKCVKDLLEKSKNLTNAEPDEAIKKAFE